MYKSLFHHVVQSSLNPKHCNRFELPYILSPAAKTVSHFLHLSLVDQMYAKEVYISAILRQNPIKKLKKSHKTLKTKDDPKTMSFFIKTIFQNYSLI